MGDVDRLVADLEKAIRLDYDAKILTLEEERDEKIARVRSVFRNDTRGGGHLEETTRSPDSSGSGSRAAAECRGETIGQNTGVADAA